MSVSKNFSWAPVRIKNQVRRLTANRYACLIVVSVLSFVLLALRWKFIQYSYPGTTSDYGAHIDFVNSLLKGNLFPGLHTDEVSDHTVSRFLPVYGGMIGSHILAAILTLFGFEIPTAMLILADLSLALSVGFLAQIVLENGASWFRGFIFLIFLPLFLLYFGLFAMQGYFAQVCGLMFCLAGLYYFLANNTKWSTIIWLVGGVFYPDYLLWCLPLLIFSKRKNWPQSKIWLSGILILEMGLFFCFFLVFCQRLYLPGDIETSMGLYVIFLAAYLIGRMLVKGPPELNRVLSYFYAVSGVWICISLLYHGKVSYYSQKLTFYFAPLCLVQMSTFVNHRRSLYGVFGVLMIYFLSVPTDPVKLGTFYYQEKTLVSSAWVSDMKKLIHENGCEKPLILPGGVPSFQAHSFILGLNSYWDNIDVPNLKIWHPSFEGKIHPFHLYFMIRDDKPRGEMLERLSAHPEACILTSIKETHFVNVNQNLFQVIDRNDTRYISVKH